MIGCAGYFAASILATASGSVSPWAAGNWGRRASSAMNPAKTLMRPPAANRIRAIREIRETREIRGLVSSRIYGSVYSLQGMRRIASRAFKQPLEGTGVRNDSQELIGSAVRRDAGAVNRLGAGRQGVPWRLGAHD